MFEKSGNCGFIECVRPNELFNQMYCPFWVGGVGSCAGAEVGRLIIGSLKWVLKSGNPKRWQQEQAGVLSLALCLQWKKAQNVTVYHWKIQRCKRWLVAIKNRKYVINTPTDNLANLHVCSKHFIDDDNERDIQSEIVRTKHCRKLRHSCSFCVPMGWIWCRAKIHWYFGEENPSKQACRVV